MAHAEAGEAVSYGQRLRDGLLAQMRVIKALIVRRLIARYGRENLGFLWVVVEPMILCVGVTVLWSFIKPSYEHGIQIIAFTVTGYMPLTLWRHISNAGSGLLRASSNLFYHRFITAYDVFMATTMAEFIGTTAATAVIVFSLQVLGLIEPLHDIRLVLAGWLMMGFLSAGFSCLLMSLTELNLWAEKFIPAFQYVLMPVSGIFYMVHWLPTSAQPLALYIPMVHCYEMIRAGFFPPGIEAVYDVFYPLYWGLCMWAVGLLALRQARRHVAID